MNRKNFFKSPLIKIYEYLTDIIIVLFGLGLTIFLANVIENGEILTIQEIFQSGINNWYSMSIYLIVSALLLRLYDTSIIKGTYFHTLKNLSLVLIFSNVILLVYSFISGEYFIFQSPYFTGFVILIQLLTYVVFKFVGYIIYHKFTRETLIIIAKNELDGKRFVSKFFLDKNHYKHVKMIVFTEGEIDVYSSIAEVVKEVDCVYVTDEVSSEVKDQIMKYVAFDTYTEIYFVPKKYEIITIGSLTERVDDMLVLRIKDMHISVGLRFLKRTIDIITSLIILVTAFIPMLIVGLIVKLQDGGPVFYKQERYKRFNEPFNVLKFRSMTNKQTIDDEQQFSTRQDKRITKFGKFIRATRLDELPQLINVLRGDMSLVGPRPLMKSDLQTASNDDPEYHYRTNVKPGITGLAQIYGRHDIDLKARLRYDLLYIRKCSLWLDIKIIFLTILTLLNRDAGLGIANCNVDEILKNEKITLEEITVGKLKGVNVVKDMVKRKKRKS